MTPKLYRVILPVSDIAQAERFYSNLLGIPGKRVSPGRHYFDCDGVILACFDPKADGDTFAARPNPDHIYFAVSDLDSAYQRAASAGCQWLEPKIERRSWGERSFYAKDPFGNPICLVDEKTVFTG
jgi:predicted enzyme related to lactoylglutathione lyase